MASQRCLQRLQRQAPLKAPVDDSVWTAWQRAHSKSVVMHHDAFLSAGCLFCSAHTAHDCGGRPLVVKDDGQEGAVDLDVTPLYSMNPRSRNLFMKKLTRERVVPIISASVS